MAARPLAITDGRQWFESVQPSNDVVDVSVGKAVDQPINQQNPRSSNQGSCQHESNRFILR